MGRHSSSPAPRQTALPRSQHSPAAPQAQPPAETAPAHTSLCPRGGKLRHEVTVRVGTLVDTLTPAANPCGWRFLRRRGRRRRWKKGWEEALGRPRCPLAASGAGAADAALGAGQRGRTDGSSGAAACARFRHLARPQAPKSGLRSGHLLPGLGKGGKKPQQWKIGGVPIKAARKPKAVSLTLPALAWVSVPEPCATFATHQPWLCSRADHRAVVWDLHSPRCPVGIPWEQAGTPSQQCVGTWGGEPALAVAVWAFVRASGCSSRWIPPWCPPPGPGVGDGGRNSLPQH